MKINSLIHNSLCTVRNNFICKNINNMPLKPYHDFSKVVCVCVWHTELSNFITLLAL